MSQKTFELDGHEYEIEFFADRGNGRVLIEATKFLEIDVDVVWEAAPEDCTEPTCGLTGGLTGAPCADLTRAAERASCDGPTEPPLPTELKSMQRETRKLVDALRGQSLGPEAEAALAKLKAVHGEVE